MRLNPNEKLTAWVKCPLPSAEGVEYLLTFMPYQKVKRQLQENAIDIHDLLLDWRGIEDQNGNPLPCNQETREMFIETAEGQKHLGWMFLAADDITNFFNLSEYLKNSQAPLSGNSITQRQRSAVA